MKRTIDIDAMVTAIPAKEKSDKQRITELEAEIIALKSRADAVELKQAANDAKIAAIENTQVVKKATKA